GHVFGVVPAAQDPLVQPLAQRARILADLRPLAVGGVVPVVVPLGEGGVRAAGALDDRVHRVGGGDGAALTEPDDLAGEHLFADPDRLLGRVDRFRLDAGEAPDLGVAGSIGPLGVHDGDVRVDRGDDVDLLGAAIGPRVGRGHLADLRVDRRDVAARVGAQRVERQPLGPRQVAADHAVVAVLLEVQRFGLAGFDAAAQLAERTSGGVADERRNQAGNAACRDHLVDDDV